MRIETLQNRVSYLQGCLDEAKKIYAAALGEANAKKEQNKSTTVDTGRTEVFTADPSNESK